MNRNNKTSNETSSSSQSPTEFGPSQSNDKPDHSIPLAPFVVLLVVTGGLAYTSDKHTIIWKDFTRPRFLFMFLLILLATFFSFMYGDKRSRIASRHALMAFFIAYFAHLDMIFATFLLVFVFVYYSEGWI